MTDFSASDALLAPAAAERFRFSNRYGQRFYRDDLGVDSLVPDGSVWEGPAISTVKKAWSKEFTKRTDTGLVVPLDGLRCGKYVAENIHTIVNLPHDSIVELVATEPRRDLDRAAQRGTGVHAIMDAYKTGVDPGDVNLTDEARRYIPCAHKVIADLRPEFVYAEMVAVSRTVGVAGTFDSVMRLPDGTTWMVDYKTRSSDGRHGCYEEEAAQVALYGRADYWIDERAGEPVRIPVPDLTGGLIISIKPDSYELFPIDLDHALEAVKALKDCWDRKREGQSAARKAIGKAIRLRFDNIAAPEPGAAPALSPDNAVPSAASPAPGPEPDLTSSANGTNVDDRTAGGPECPAALSPLEAHQPSADDLLTARRAWLVARLEALKATDNGVAFLVAKQAEDGLPRITESDHDQITAWSDNFWTAETHYKMPFPDEDPAFTEAQRLAREAGLIEAPAPEVQPQPESLEPAPADERAGIAARILALPADLHDEILAFAESNGVGRVVSRDHVFTAEHATMLTGWLPGYEQRASDRLLVVNNWVERAADGDKAISDIVFSVALVPPDRDVSFTGLVAERIVSVCESLVADVLHLEPNGPHAYTITVADDADKVVMYRYTTKRAALTSAKALAKTHGLAVPTSVAAVLASPLLLALTLRAGGATPPNEQPNGAT